MDFDICTGLTWKWACPLSFWLISDTRLHSLFTQLHGNTELRLKLSLTNVIATASPLPSSMHAARGRPSSDPAIPSVEDLDMMLIILAGSESPVLPVQVDAHPGYCRSEPGSLPFTGMQIAVLGRRQGATHPRLCIGVSSKIAAEPALIVLALMSLI